MDKQRNPLAHYTLSTPPPPSEPSNRFGGKDWLFLLLPFLLVGASVLYFTWGQAKPATVTASVTAPESAAAPAKGEFTIDKYLASKAGEIQIIATNGSDRAVTIPQVIADDAYWAFDATPATLVPPGGVVTFTLPYPWVADELPEVMLITSHGETIASEVEPITAASGEISATTSSK